MKIMGDPDWILTSTGINSTKSKLKAETKSTSLSKVDSSLGPSMFDGQLMTQVIFNTANDYLNTGLMDVSDQVVLMGPGERDFNIKGTIYITTHVTSSFSKGTFTQTLTLSPVPSGSMVTNSSGKSVDGRESNTGSGGAGGSTRPTSTAPGDFIAADARATEAQQVLSQKQSAYEAMSSPDAGLSDSKPATTSTVQNGNKDDKNISEPPRLRNWDGPTPLTPIISTVRETVRGWIGTPTYVNPQTDLKLPRFTNPVRK
jgi:hypothetical protein